MKRVLFGFAVLLVIFSIACDQSAQYVERDDDDDDREVVESPAAEVASTVYVYGYGSGIVEYKIEGSISGHQTLYWTGNGTNVAEYEESGISADYMDKKIKLYNSSNMLILDIENKIVFEASPRFAKMIDVAKTVSDFESYKGDKKDLITERLDDEEILGFSCQVMKLGKPDAHLIQWVHKGVILREDSFFNGSLISSRVATSFQPDAQVPEEMLNPPADYKKMTQIEYQEFLNNLNK